MSHSFEWSSEFPASPEQLFGYHANPGAIDRLIPPWERITILRRGASIDVGAEVVLQQRLGPLRLKWLARHTNLDAPRSFQDTQISGPFAFWQHDHLIEAVDEERSRLRDRIRFDLPWAPLSNIALPMVRSMLRRMFVYRHETTRRDLELHDFLAPWVSGRSLRIAITGSSGMIGSRLAALASVLGHRVVRIIRPESQSASNESGNIGESVVWDRQSGFNRLDAMQDLDAVVHLGGFGIAERRWTEETKRKIRSSRIDGTHALVKSLTDLSSPPKALVCASGVGIYGDCGDRECLESSPPADDFLGQVAKDWEAAARTFESSGGRVAIGRLAMVLHPHQGALAKMLPLLRWGLGGRIGNGHQSWSWIHLDDAVAAFLFLAACPDASGPFNFASPHGTTNREFTRTLARALSRPAWFPAPAPALRIALGEMADALLLASTRAVPQRLEQMHFPFRARRLEDALAQLLGDA
ncbi:Epimerase family protein [Pirellula sp. SH-Sr6A]|uniref:TIGR01777 family oxidoreductase n=1 Tax=Pirellula sp. SH-Sr6A TaxID=1632865 RepID=UPI00078B7871|nr:TIGR01777 family oxidoreductase [Pirellula sp. SH-Sr6A]AMV33309.1 Epimerase family protein [Pirellula sp. SH-Sr6A]